MREQAPVYDIRTATTKDIPELLALQADNQIGRGGALSVEFPATWFADVIRDMPIVTAWREHRLVGFLVSSSKEATQHLPLSQAKFSAYPAGPNAYNSGPLCIAARNEGKVWWHSCSTSSGRFCRAARASHSFAGTTRRRARRTASMVFGR